MDREMFDGLIKDVMADLYDYAALETHPLLFSVFQVPAGYTGSKGEYLRQVILDTLEELRPPTKGSPGLSVEWRPYLILTQRFVEGMSITELAARLSVSDRQLRRDQHKALQALSARLWDKLGLRGDAQDKSGPGGQPAYVLNRERVDVHSVVEGVLHILHRRLEEEGVSVQRECPPAALSVVTDRVILRQIMISIFNYAFHMRTGGELCLRCRSQNQHIHLSVEAPLETALAAGDEAEGRGLLKAALYWSEQIGAQLNEERIANRLILTLSLESAAPATILVVDDQEPAINMFRRYLSRTDWTIVGLTHPDQVLEKARQLKPALITLDVMMPHVDGWEVLQALKLDPQVGSIPVIVCSAWEEAELARSLGAAAFLKKPVTQKDLLDSLQRLHFSIQ